MPPRSSVSLLGFAFKDVVPCSEAIEIFVAKLEARGFDVGEMQASASEVKQKRISVAQCATLQPKRR